MTALANRSNSHRSSTVRTQETFKLLQQNSAIDLAFHNLRYVVHPHKLILNNISGEMRNGELTAIIGGSGAGKTTLLNILSGYKTSNIQGHVTVNGVERNLKTFRKISSYIMQDDYLHGNLTLKESMSIAAELKLPDSVTKTEKRLIISEILQTLRLTEHVNTLTHRLSGGERKRLSIGLELISNPPIMFFDEPTSGLDSLTCFQCIKLLKMLAVGGRNIICTVHQPSARLLEMFDQLYAMANGQCIYQGKIAQLLPYLHAQELHCPSYSNPTDYLIEIVSEEQSKTTDKLVKMIRNGQRNVGPDGLQDVKYVDYEPSSLATPPYTVVKLCEVLGEPHVDKSAAQNFPVSSWRQFWILSKRAFINTKRDLTLTYLRIGTQFVVSFFMCAILGGSGNDASHVISNFTLLQFVILYLTSGNMIVSVLVIPSETSILSKEHFNQWYSLKSYFLAVSIVDLPFQMVTCTIFASVIYYFSEQPLEWFRFLYFLLFCILLSFTAQSAGFLVGSACSIKTSIVLVMAFNVPCLLYAGYFVPFSHIPAYLQWASYASYMRYGFEGITLAIYGFHRAPIKCFKTYCPLRNCEHLLEFFAIREGNVFFDIGMLLVFFVGLRFLAYFFLKWKLRRKQ